MEPRTRQPLTLFDVVRTIFEISDDEREATAVLQHMLQTGQIRPAGSR